MIALRWIARVAFVVALLTWGKMALRSTHHPETWATTRQRTAAFVVMVAAGWIGFPTPKPGPKGSRRRERYWGALESTAQIAQLESTSEIPKSMPVAPRGRG